MGTLWRLLAETLTKDDLFLRVILFVFSFFTLWLGVEAIRWLINSGDEHWGWILTIGLVGTFFLLWGGIVLVSAFTPPASRWSQLAEKCYPNPSALDDVAILFVAVLLPAVVLTLVLRALGVRGYVA